MSKRNVNLFAYLASLIILTIMTSFAFAEQGASNPSKQVSQAEQFDINQVLENTEFKTLMETFTVPLIYEDHSIVPNIEEPIEINEEVEAEIPVVEEEPIKLYSVTSHYLNVRDGGSANDSIIKVVKMGTQFEIINTLDNGWVELADGGFVNSKYLQEVEIVNGSETIEVTQSIKKEKKEVTVLSTGKDYNGYYEEVTDSKNIVNPIKEGLTTKSNLTVEEIEKLLEGTDMHGVGIAEAILDVEDIHDINALVTLAIARLESGNGSSKIAREKNNLFGLNAIDGDAFKNAFSYDEPADSVYAFGEILKSKYIDKGYDTLAKINKKYSTSSEWQTKVSNIIKKDFKLSVEI